MKNNKKKFVYLALIALLIMSIAGTASAYYYTGSCNSNFRTTGTVTLINYVEDANSRCYFCPNATEYDTGYTSTAWKTGDSTNYSSHVMSSGGDYLHAYTGSQGTGYLRFYNTEATGNKIYLYGNIN